ncbi:MAG: tetratricopeptide repeat protein [Gemmatimonadota bacterium]|nr:MAG: tetratricopeptide repeat protein [Gemmatimonadota bacterium]
MDRGDPLEGLFVRYREIEEALDRAEGRAESIQLISAITELYKALNQVEGRVAELKVRLRGLVEGNKWLSDEAAEPVAGAAPPVYSDKLGSSTFKQKGWDCIAVGDYGGAKEMLKRALELAADDLEALSTLGWAQALSHDYDDALMTYQRVLAAKPDDEQARVNLGYICLKKKIYGEAVEHLSTAIRSSTDRKAALYGHYYLGLVYLAREMFDDAETYFQKTIELGPAMSEAYFQLGRARYLAGRRADAISAWRDGIAANAFNPWAKRCSDAVRAVEAGELPPLD